MVYSSQVSLVLRPFSKCITSLLVTVPHKFIWCMHHGNSIHTGALAHACKTINYHGRLIHRALTGLLVLINVSITLYNVLIGRITSKIANIDVFGRRL